ncbi:hypothetical protein GCM10009528_31120 [Kineococcus aurantiacus]
MRAYWHGGDVSPDGEQARSQPLLDLPLPRLVAVALESLMPPRGRPTRGPGERGRLGNFKPVSEGAARQWLGFDPPTLPSLEAVGFSRYFARRGAWELIPRTELGRGESAAVYVFYLPPGVEWVLGDDLRRSPAAGADVLVVAGRLRGALAGGHEGVGGDRARSNQW